MAALVPGRKRQDIELRTCNIKKKLPEVLKEVYENVTEACKRCDIPTATFYTWYHNDPVFKAACDESKATTHDYVRSKLVENISNNKENSVFYWLNNKGQEFGWNKPIEQKKTSDDIADKEHEANRKTMEERAYEIAEEIVDKRMKEFMAKYER